MKTPTGKQFLAALLIVGALGFLVATVARDLPRIRAFPWQVRPALLLLSTASLSLLLAWGVRVWQLTLRRFDVRIGWVALARVWFLSNVARYIPGKIWQFVGVAQLGSSAGLPAAIGVTSLMVHMGFTLVAASLVGLLLLPPGFTGLEALEELRWLTPLALLAVHPRPIRAALCLAGRFSRRPLEEWRGSWGDGIWLVALNGASWLVYGGAFYLFVAALSPIEPTRLAALTAMNALAFVAGYVALLPAGLGLKELALTGMLASVVPVPVAAALALATRLWTVAAELIPALPLLATARRHGRAGSGPADRWRGGGGAVSIPPTPPEERPRTS
ncbi:hypothetical protein BH20GEM2_BH20GEM2_07610 [soil metagenome]